MRRCPHLAPPEDARIPRHGSHEDTAVPRRYDIYNFQQALLRCESRTQLLCITTDAPDSASGQSAPCARVRGQCAPESTQVRRAQDIQRVVPCAEHRSKGQVAELEGRPRSRPPSGAPRLVFAGSVTFDRVRAQHGRATCTTQRKPRMHPVVITRTRIIRTHGAGRAAPVEHHAMDPAPQVECQHRRAQHSLPPVPLPRARRACACLQRCM